MTQFIYLSLFLIALSSQILAFVKNLFNITEGTDDRLNSSLILFNAGRYHYIIRQQTSTTNLDTSLSGNIVERGIMLLADFETSQYIQHENKITYKVHEPI